MNNKYLTFGLVALFFIEVVFMLAHCVRRANPTIFTASSTSPWWLFFLSSAGFFLPIILFGSTMTYSRYYLPSLLPLMLALLLGIDAIFVLPPKKSFSLLKAIVIGCLIAALTQSTLFVYRSYAHLAALDLDKLDKVQYLEEWSSGFGISEVLATAENKASPDHKILLISEGSFGTPTDALNLYLLAARDSNVAVEGIGWQIHNIPQSALDRAANEYDETWLVVNSHRLFMTMPEQKPLLNIPRPNPAAPTLQVWRIM